MAEPRRIALMPGDGIGQEVMAAAAEVLQALSTGLSEPTGASKQPQMLTESKIMLAVCRHTSKPNPTFTLPLYANAERATSSSQRGRRSHT